MGKGDARLNPDKPQNREYHNGWCQYAEEHNGQLYCEGGIGDTSICKGNRYNCIKTLYHRLASRSDAQKEQ